MKQENFTNLTALFVKYFNKTLSHDEYLELQSWLKASNRNRNFFQHIESEQLSRHQLEQFSERYSQLAYHEFLIHRKQYGSHSNQFFRNQRWLRYAAAVLLPLTLMVTFYLQERESLVDVTTETPVLVSGERYPTLILSDGRTVLLDDTLSLFTEQKGITLLKREDGVLAYRGEDVENEELQYHELHVPRESDYHFILSDGTKVWVNAESELRYPVTFAQTDRTIFVQGEIYLEVAKEAARPFYVVLDGMKVEVLGTSFNVKAYPEDHRITVTLVEGSIKANLNNQNYTLTPHDCLLFDKSSGSAIISKQEVDYCGLWRYGQYVFNMCSLGEIGKILERWYNVRIVFGRTKIESSLYTGVVIKDEPIEIFLNRLAMASQIRIRREGEIVYIE